MSQNIFDLTNSKSVPLEL